MTTEETNEQVLVHPRISERHPELTEEDVAHAWGYRTESKLRLESGREEYIGVGFDANGRLIEMVAVYIDSHWLIYHAMTPPSKKTFTELGIGGK